MLSTVLNGSKVRLLVNDGWEPETEEIVTLASLLDKAVLPFNQVTSMSVIETSVSVAGLMEMVHVRVRGAILPAISGPGGTVMSTSGLETGRNDVTVLMLTTLKNIAMRMNILCTKI